MSRFILIRATWDEDAKVWTATSQDLPGLVTEADSLNALDAKLPGLIQDLLDDDDCEGPIEIPIEVVASFSRTLRFASRGL